MCVGVREGVGVGVGRWMGASVKILNIFSFFLPFSHFSQIVRLA